MISSLGYEGHGSGFNMRHSIPGGALRAIDLFGATVLAADATNAAGSGGRDSASVRTPPPQYYGHGAV